MNFIYTKRNHLQDSLGFLNFEFFGEDLNWRIYPARQIRQNKAGAKLTQLTVGCTLGSNFKETFHSNVLIFEDI